MSGARHRQKGIARSEKSSPCTRRSAFTVSGSRSRGVVDIGAMGPMSMNGRDVCPFVCEVKSRRDGEGFATVERWLSDYDALFLRRNNSEPLVVLPWRVWRSLLQRS